MKSFKDIKFKSHPVGDGVLGQIFFPNGYGVSVVRYKMPFSRGYGSYTSNEEEWEVAILKGNKDEWDLCYDTEITNDVMGHLSEGEVNWVMLKVQELPSVDIYK